MLWQWCFSYAVPAYIVARGCAGLASPFPNVVNKWDIATVFFGITSIIAGCAGVVALIWSYT